MDNLPVSPARWRAWRLLLGALLAADALLAGGLLARWLGPGGWLSAWWPW